MCDGQYIEQCPCNNYCVGGSSTQTLDSLLSVLLQNSGSIEDLVLCVIYSWCESLDF